MKTRVLLSLALIFGAVCMNVKAIDPVKDTYSYPARNAGKYTLTSKWLYSLTTETYNSGDASLKLNTAQGTVRAMAYWNDKLIFGSRNDGPAIIIINSTTGAVESTLPVVAPGFEAIQNPCNYIVVDDGNNVLVGNVKLAPPSAGVLQIWKVDMATGVGTKLVEMGPESLAASDRIDAFNVLGDVNGDATIWAVSSTSTDASMNMFRWKVTNGVVSTDPDLIIIDFSAGGFPSNVTGVGTSPCVFPITEDLVYIDGSNTYPTLMQITGDDSEGYTAVAIDGFYDILDATLPIPNSMDDITEPGKEFSMLSSHNGFAQFTVGSEHFFVIPINSHVVPTGYPNTPYQAFRLYKYKDDAKKAREAEILWTFPNVGLSPNTNNQNNFFITPIEATVSGTKATIYIYSGENGLAAYEFDTNASVGFHNPKAALLVYGSDKSVHFGENVASVQIYSIAGQLVAKKANTDNVNIAAPGVYVVKATTLNGETLVSKVIVK
jgi:hypothetical protein